ncbi:hypothetical protein [Streptosporangium sp. NPDC048865]
MTAPVRHDPARVARILRTGDARGPRPCGPPPETAWIRPVTTAPAT